MGHNWLRVQIERDDVRKVELEWYIGDAKKAKPVHIDDADRSGILRTVRTPKGKLQAILEAATPETGKPLVLDLLLTTATGEILKEEIVLQRGRDRNDDGSKDRGGK